MSSHKSAFPIANIIILAAMVISSVSSVAAIQPTRLTDISQPQPTGEFAPERLIVRLKEGAQLSEATALAPFVLAAQPLFESATAQLSQVYILELIAGSDVPSLAKSLSTDPRVVWAEPDYLARPVDTIQVTPDDPLFPSQWGLSKIDIEAAWDVNTGSNSVVIAILDSGIQLDHPDLQNRLWINPGEIPGNGIDDDNNGFIDDVKGWNFVSDNNNPADDNGHGTQVAGVAIAETNNTLGIAGTCWGCTLMPVKVMSAGGIANYSDIAAGTIYAAVKGAEVVNISLGGYSYSHALEEAVQEAVNTYHAMVIAGAGNDNRSSLFYPAAYTQVMAVAGTDQNDIKTSFSNYGSWVDLTAPAIDITTTFMGGDYGSAEGTSFSAPFVSGVVGLILSQHPDWNQALVWSQLTHTADPLDALNPSYAGMLGSGRLNAGAALTTGPAPLLTISSSKVNGDPQGRPVPGQSAALEITLTNGWLDAQGVAGTLTTSDPYVTITQGNASFGDIPSGGSGTSNPLYAFNVASGAGYDHSIVFTLEVTANGGAYTTTLNFFITTRSAEEQVGGTIGVDTTWTSDKTYIVTNNVGVAPGVTLTIQAGTIIEFNGNYSLNIGGQLLADGTESQPILFTKHNGNSWGRIYFDDTSIDATADISGTYQSGNILRWVNIEGADQGIGCNNATPYLGHLTTDGGYVDCLLGNTSSWIIDSNLGGSVSFSGSSSHVIHVDVPFGMLFLSAGVVQDSTIRDSIYISFTGIVESSIVSAGGIILGENSIIKNSSTNGDGINIASGSVLSNTISGGGINTWKGTEVRGNNVEGSSGWAIQSSGTANITQNRLVGNAFGISTSGGLIQGNLVANSSGVAIGIYGDSTVVSNTITTNSGSAIKLNSGADIVITGNNLEGNLGTYNIENLTTTDIPAQNNWWGTTDPSTISQRIYDYDDDYSLGEVVYQPVAAGPIQSAPAYVYSVTVTPNPVGIETANFDIEFSLPMDFSTSPMIEFNIKEIGTVQFFTTENSGLTSNMMWDVAADSQNNIWFPGVGATVHYKDGTWENFTTQNSDIGGDGVWSMEADPLNNIWFSTGNGISVRYPNGTWDSYDTSNSGLASNNVYPIMIDHLGNRWFGTDSSGLSVFNLDGSWQTYNTGNSGITGNRVVALSEDQVGNIWIGAESNGISILKSDGSWVDLDICDAIYHQSISVDQSGNIWVGTYCGVYIYHPNGSMEFLDTSNSGLIANEITTITFDVEGNVWFGTRWSGICVLHPNGSWESFAYGPDVIASVISPTYAHWFTTLSNGAFVFWGGDIYQVANNPIWLDSSHYQASYDITSLNPRDTYKVTVAGAVGLDGIEIAPNSAYTFTVDYAGGIGDTTPPSTPQVTACAGNTPDTLSAAWVAYDPDSQITRYEYAIGTSPSSADVVNWTTTSDTSFTRNGLVLVPNQKYYVSVRARNEGGLWSTPGTTGVLAGSGACTTNIIRVYLPMANR